MTLNRRLPRTLAAMASFTIVSSLLTALVVAFVISTLTTSATLNRVLPQFLTDNSVEDAEFTTVVPIDETAAAGLEDEFAAVVSRQRSLDVDVDGATLRFLSASHDVNRVALLEGRMPSAADELVLSPRTAAHQGWTVGSRLSAGDHEFTVVGIGVRPDYLYPLRQGTDAYPRFDTFGTAVVLDEAMDQLGPPRIQYAVRFLDPDRVLDLRRSVDEQYTMLTYLSGSANQRIDFARQTGDSLGRVTMMFTPLVAVLVLVIVALVLSRKVRTEQREMGALAAMGYRSGELTRHYLWMALIPGCVGVVIGMVVGWRLLDPVAAVYFGDFDTVPYEHRLNPVVVVVSGLAPIAGYGVVAAVTIGRLLRQPPIELLRRAKEGATTTGRPTNRPATRWRRSLKWRTVRGHVSRSIVVLVSVMVAGLCVFSGLTLNDSVSWLVSSGSDNQRYEYLYALTTPVEEPPPDADGALVASFEVDGHQTPFQLWGIDIPSRFIDVRTVEGAQMDADGFYLTRAAARAYGVEVGDTFSFREVTTAREYEIVIAGVIDDDVTMAVYAERGAVADLVGVPASFNTVLLSEVVLSLDDGLVSTVVSKHDSQEALSQVLGLFRVAAGIIIAFGFLLGVMLVYVMTNMVVEDQSSTISLFKVLGYRPREINAVVLGTNHVVVAVGFVMSVPVTLAVCTAVFAGASGTMGIALAAHPTARSLATAAVIVAVAYLVSLQLLKRKTYRIDMVESLKDNRE